MKTHDVQQGSTAWYMLRMGVVTASEFDHLITSKWKVREGAGVDTYLYRKLAEKILNWSPEMLDAFAVDQGKILETIAIPWFEFEHGKKVKRVGFCTSDDGRSGCSPDGLLEDGTGIEIKCPQAPNHIRYLIENRVPDDYLAQVHFSMLVTGAARWTFVSYHMTLPALVINVQRDEAIQAKMREVLAGFTERFDASLKIIQSK